MTDLEHTLESHEGIEPAKAARWTAIMQRDLSRLWSSLEAHRFAFEMALKMVTSTFDRDIKAGTKDVLESNS